MSIWASWPNTLNLMPQFTLCPGLFASHMQTNCAGKWRATIVGLPLARSCPTLCAAQVTLRAELFGDQTTSQGAAGLWEPYKLGAQGFRVYATLSIEP